MTGDVNAIYRFLANDVGDGKLIGYEVGKFVTGLPDRFSALPEFPFRRLAKLYSKIEPAQGLDVLDLSVGEPKHAPPDLLLEAIAANAGSWNRYPPAIGTTEFRETAANWLTRRFGLQDGLINPDVNILPLAGTKEGLFLLPSILPAKTQTIALMPNPLYSVYAGAAALAGSTPIGLSAYAENRFLPDLDQLDEGLLQRTNVFFLCSPSNPQGSVAKAEYLERLLKLARKHEFLLVLDECYSEIYDTTPPVGGLEIAQSLGGGLKSLVVMHSLSKRSNAAGLRSGFIAGDAEVLSRFAKLRAYGGAVQPMPLMAAAIQLWRDEQHVEDNRRRYRRKIDIAERHLDGKLGFYRPEGGFFLWLDVGKGVQATETLWREAAVKVVPGRFFTFAETDRDPGDAYIRVALVHDETITGEALRRIARTLG